MSYTESCKSGSSSLTNAANRASPRLVFPLRTEADLFPNMQPIRAVLFDKDGTLVDFQRTWGPATHSVLTEISSGDCALFDRLAAVSLYDSVQRTLLPGS